MKLLRFVLDAPWRVVLFSGAAGLLSGLLSIGLIAVINDFLYSSAAERTLLLTVFLGLVIAKLVAHAVARMLLARYTQGAIARMRQDLGRRVLQASLRAQERIGAARLVATLTEDVQSLSVALRDVPNLVVNVAIVVGAACYLAWLSWSVFAVIAGVAAIGSIGYQWFVGRGTRLLRRARLATDELHKHFHALIEGMRELKLHRGRREAFLTTSLDPASDEFKNLRVSANDRFIAGQSWNQLLLYGLIGVLLLVAPTLETMSADAMTGYLLTIVYLVGPVAALNAMLPNLAVAEVALQRVESLGLALVDEEEPVSVQATSAVSAIDASEFSLLSLHAVTFAYEHAVGDRDFRLGPVDLELNPGEVVFIVGGNGSGKSTLAKLLCGLYEADAGHIEVDGQTVTSGNLDWYRSHFSAVFANPFLFETLLGLESPDRDALARQYLAELDLANAVTIEEGRISTTSLSDGQRKRLALLTAYLEDRPIYVFDEWAADQDPEFKLAFYEHMLPELKARGKTAVVISHDDRYFAVADRLVRLEEGNVAGASRVSGTSGTMESEPS